MESIRMGCPGGQQKERIKAGLPIVISLSIILGLLASCATTLPVRTDYDRNTDFSSYQTFTWVGDNPLILPKEGNPRISALNRERIVTAIVNELERKGYTMAAAGEADFAVAYTVGTRDRIDVDSYPLSYRGRWYWTPSYWEYEIRARTYEEGMLSIDIFDQNTHRPVWHGFTHKRITQSDVRDPEPAIQKAVAAILAKFPPS